MQVKPYVPDDRGPMIAEVLTETAQRRAVAVQAAFALIGQYTDGDMMTSDVLEVARYIDAAAVA